MPLHSDLQLDVHLLPLHLGSCLPRLWPAHHSARGHGKVFSRGKWVGDQAISRKKNLSQVDLPNIETGSPHMSGTVRDKIFVGQVSRKRNARECQEWCQVGATFKFQKRAKPDLNRDLFKAGQFFKICLKIIPLQTVPECKSWSWASPQHSTPLACSLHYGEHRCDLLVISPFLDALAYLASLATPIPSLA